MENNNKGNGIFLGVIGVATLVVAIIGATFAFFSANASSDPNAIETTSTKIALGFDDDTDTNEKALKTNLIPAADRLAIYGANNQSGDKECIDDNTNEICSTYTFTVANPSATTAQRIFTNITVQTNTFGNLYFALYEVNDGTVGEQVIAPTPFIKPATGETPGVSYSTNEGGKTVVSLDAITQYLGVSETAISDENKDDMSKYTVNTTEVAGQQVQNMKTYKLIIWIHELKPETGANPEADYNQNDSDAGRSFAAGINISTSAGGSGVTAVISAAGAAPTQE